jgi:hypothetical protein
MIRDIEIAFSAEPVIKAHTYSHGENFHRLILEIDNLTLRIDLSDAKRLRDALNQELGSQESERIAGICATFNRYAEMKRDEIFELVTEINRLKKLMEVGS